MCGLISLGREGKEKERPKRFGSRDERGGKKGQGSLQPCFFEGTWRRKPRPDKEKKEGKEKGGASQAAVGGY